MNMIKVLINWQKIRGQWWVEDIKHTKEEKLAATKMKVLFDVIKIYCDHFTFYKLFLNNKIKNER